MSKLSYKDKINLYKDKKQGISTKSLSKKYKIRTCLVDYLISLIDKHGYDIVERKRGRTTMPKVTKKEENETKDEKIKRLEEENLYLKAELEYSKKLRAVVQARKNQQQKKK